MEKDQKIVTRFAPSPTGFMHIGGVRTALFAYLLARKNKGTFLLRIEDTDKDREVKGSIQHIQDALSWLGITWDYGPDKPGPFGSCIQSERLASYHEYALKLIEKGLAYPDPYTPAEVEKFREDAKSAKEPFLYRKHRPAVIEKWDGKKPLRFKIPEIKRYHWHDVVRGDLEAGEDALDDFIIIKSDGFPTYNFAHIIDDLNMSVTHILRADEFISSTPRFLSLYEALKIKPPIFVTLPPILREDHTKKLGKRDGAKDVLEYRAEGYLPEAMLNVLALIGWNPGTTKELFTKEELINDFEIEKIQKSGGSFDEMKLDWFNHQYISKLSDEAFADHASTFLPEWMSTNSPVFRNSITLIREKITRFSDITKLFNKDGELAFLKEMPEYEPTMLLWKKEPSAKTSLNSLEGSLEIVTSVPDNTFTPDAIKVALWSYAETNGKGNVLWPLRVALTGQEKSPDPFVCASLLGKEETLKRMKNAISKLS